jgi:uncharacterized membrane protein
MRAVRVASWLGLFALVVGCVVVYPSLPTTIPHSIGASGRAERLVARTPLMWGLPVAISVATMLLLEWLRSRLPTKPALFNFPGKERLLKLQPEYQTEAIRSMQGFMDVMNLQLLVTFALVQWMIWRGAHGQRMQGVTIALLLMNPVMLVAMGLYLSRLQKVVDEATGRYEGRRNPLRP